MTADEFSKSVNIGLKLSQRIYYGKDGPPIQAPKPAAMTKCPTLQSQLSSTSSFRLPDKHHPTAPMVYAIIIDPDIVDNPDIRSYQPHVYGRCNPPALIPLHMHAISMNVDCYLDKAFAMVTGVWCVHCVTASACCDCRIAIPLGEQGSLLDVDVETTKRSYFTKLITHRDDEKDLDQVAKAKDGFMMKRNTYTLKIPQVEGGSIIRVKVRWSQKLLYEGDEFCLNVPFTFPSYVLPLEKTTPKIEKVSLNVNSGTETMITCRFASHPLKEVQQQAGEASFVYEAEVLKWSTQEFYFAYSVCSNEIIGGLLLQHSSLYDFDQRDIFCFYLFPGTNRDNKVYKKEMIFLLDISGSMRDAPLEHSKYVITASLSKLNQGDSFNIIVFNGDIQSFSSSLELVTEETITNATEWLWENLVAEGGTNLMSPLKQALDMVGKTGEAIPLIFLITDGSVEDERDICNMVKCSLMDGGMNSPRIFTFGIGSYCNHYFLQMLAHDVDSIGDRMERLLDNASSPMLANLYPSRIPDLLSESPLIVSGRYQGKFPEFVKARGVRADLSNYVIDVKVRNITDTHMEKICARMEVDILTAHAWLDQSTHMEDKVAKMSLQRGIPSEYTRMILVQNNKLNPTLNSLLPDEKHSKPTNQKTIYLTNICVGFGNLKATVENLPPGIEDVKLNEAVKMVIKAASSCYGFMASWGCWRCLMQTLSQVKNNHCALAITQLCTALACLEFLDCCCDLCDSCIDFVDTIC